MNTLPTSDAKNRVYAISIDQGRGAKVDVWLGYVDSQIHIFVDGKDWGRVECDAGGSILEAFGRWLLCGYRMLSDEMIRKHYEAKEKETNVTA